MILQGLNLTEFNLLKTKEAQCRLRHIKFISSCSVQEGFHSLLQKKNIKLAKKLEVKDFKGAPLGLTRMSNLTNYLCKKGLQKITVSLKAIPQTRNTSPLFGFRLLKSLKSLTCDLMLFPGRSKQGENWGHAFKSLIDSSKNLQRLALSFTSCYTIPGEIKEVFSKVTTKRSLKNVSVEFANVLGRGDQILTDMTCLFKKSPMVSIVTLKKGYSGLKVSSETYSDFLSELSYLKYLESLNLDFDIACKIPQPKKKCIQNSICEFKKLKSAIINVELREETFKHLHIFLDGLRSLENLKLKLCKNDYSTMNTHDDWLKLAETIEQMNYLKSLNIEYKDNNRIMCKKDRSRCNIINWLQTKMMKLNKTSPSHFTETDHSEILDILLEIPHKIRNLKDLNLKFPNSNQRNLKTSRHNEIFYPQNTS